MIMKNQDNLTRMIQLAHEIFGMQLDSRQLSIDQKVITRLRKIHPNTMTEKRTKKGPIAWILFFPTTKNLMNQFMRKQISERELFEKTPLHTKYDALYLCSALVLPEYRRKGIAKQLACKAVRSILKQHPIQSFFYWPFSNEGKKLAVSIAQEFSMPLLKRIESRKPSRPHKT
jgi:hypothetical protein